MKNNTSQSLVDAFLQGDKKAFNQLVKLHQEYCLYKAQKIVRDPELAKDLVQESFIQAYKHITSLRNRSNFKSWMGGIVRNVCHNFIRRNKNKTTPLEGHLEDRAIEECEYTPAEHERFQHQINKAIDNLPLHQKQIIQDFYYQNLSVREIAKLRDLTESNVKIKLYRARKRLRDLMGGNAYAYARNINLAFTYDPNYLIKLVKRSACYGKVEAVMI